jgi:type II secretory pathway component PulF
MPAYTYVARDGAGKRITGDMDALDENDIAQRLQKMGLMATRVAQRSSIEGAEFFLKRFHNVRSEDLLMFYVQLSNMIGAGLTILLSLSTLARQTENERLRSAITAVERNIQSGSSLSAAFGVEESLFSSLFVHMVKAGEASGNLEAVLARYVEFFEKHIDMKEKIKGALYYPIILLCAGLLVMLLIVTFVIPKFADIYTRSGVILPLPTRIVYGSGIFIKQYWYALLAGIFLFIGGMSFAFKDKKMRAGIDTVVLHIPLVSGLVRRIAIARFARTLGTLLSSGVPILQALDIAKSVMDNAPLEAVVVDVRRNVEKGSRMSEPLKASGMFPADIVQMVSVGEESGALIVMLNKVADFYEVMIGFHIKKLTILIEPLFLVVMGGMVGCIMASILLPMFGMVK